MKGETSLISDLLVQRSLIIGISEKVETADNSLLSPSGGGHGRGLGRGGGG